jgi:hypothetical protein
MKGEHPILNRVKHKALHPVASWIVSGIHYFGRVQSELTPYRKERTGNTKSTSHPDLIGTTEPPTSRIRVLQLVQSLVFAIHEDPTIIRTNDADNSSRQLTGEFGLEEIEFIVLSGDTEDGGCSSGTDHQDVSDVVDEHVFLSARVHH